MKKSYLFTLTTTIFAITFSSAVSAEALPITSYDLQQTPVSGFGCWYHDYTGIIVDTGRTVSGSVICSTDGIGHVLNYSNGSGTLNDGLLTEAHLLLTRADDQGQPLQPAITLHFINTNTINEIRLLKTGFTRIASVTVDIGGTEIQLTPTSIDGNPLNVLLDLRGTALAGIPTNKIILKNFSAQYLQYTDPIDQFAISEIEVDGTYVVLLPTDIGQCQNNGWKNFDFNNQGRCIEFVNTGKTSK